MSILMETVPRDWYVAGFGFSEVDEVEPAQIETEVERALALLAPPPGGQVLDLACGAGRHAIALAERGFRVTGVDLSADMAELAQAGAEAAGIDMADLTVVPADLRDLDLEPRFDAVLNLNGGAIGYFETDAENQRTFETIARALRPGGVALMQLPNPRHVERHLTPRTWSIGIAVLELVEHRWDPTTRCLEGARIPIRLDDYLFEPTPFPFRQRLYDVEELRHLLPSVGLSLLSVRAADGTEIEPTDAEPEVLVVAVRDGEVPSG